jgi:hypothetical protein
MSNWFVFSSTASVTKITNNVLLVAAGGDFGALQCQSAQKFEKSTHLQFCKSRHLKQHAVLNN